MKKALIIIICIGSVLIVKSQVTVGAMAPEISLPDTKDSLINLSSFKGKVVLIDFWASWCGPCRRSNPGIVNLYNKYKAKGFEVFGVSIDSKKRDWVHAIANDKINYAQVNDHNGWNSVIVEKYGINQIPTSFLLDKTGKIIAIDPDEKQLENKIQKLL